MASLAQDRISGQTGRGKAAKAPLSTHPAFPFIVGLWFAALLGIGSLVVPVPAIERLVEITGLSAIVPQTAPPLGFTARALIALGCTVGGGLVGLLIARKVAQAHAAPKVRKDRSQLAARRPISAHDELGEDGFDGNAPRGRRSLAIIDEEGPSEVFELAPLPGKSLPLSALDLDEVEALDLADAAMIAEEPSAMTDAAASATPGFTTLADYNAAAAPHEAAGDDFSMAERQHFRLDTFGQTVGAPIQPRQQFVLDPVPPAQEPAAEAEAPAEEADLHFSPPSLARPFARPDAQPDPGADETEEAVMDDFAEPAGLEPAPTPPTAAPAAADWQDGEPDDVVLVQLAQRLGSSIARRREQRAAAAAALAASAAPAAVAAAAPVLLAEDFDAAEAAEAAQAMAAYFGAPAAAAPAAAPATPAASAPAFAQPAIIPPAVAAPAAVVTPLTPPAPAAPPTGRQVFRPVETAPATTQPAPLANLAHIDLSEEDDDSDEHIASLTASFSLPLAGKAPTVQVVEEDEEEETLVAPASPAPFANPFQHKAQAFVRIENEPQPDDGTIEPAVVFPGEARADTGPAASPASAQENERALREALLNLQRMSGVA